MLNKHILALASSLALGLPMAASAGDAGSFYAGAGVGLAQYESSDFVDCFGTCDNFSDSDVAFGLFAGYQATESVAVEVGYWDWGTGEDSFDGDQAEVEPEMFTLMAVGRAPIADNLSLYGKAGIAFLSVDGAVLVNGNEVASGSSDSEDLALGGGLQWDLGAFGIRGEAVWVDAEDADKAMMFNVSGLYKFGG